MTLSSGMGSGDERERLRNELQRREDEIREFTLKGLRRPTGSGKYKEDYDSMWAQVNELRSKLGIPLHREPAENPPARRWWFGVIIALTAVAVILLVASFAVSM